jgi:glycosyltransferase involved in cell wall biosynthesis
MKSYSEKITILMPLKDQKKEFLRSAIESVINQIPSDWILFIIVESETPVALKKLINSYSDSRIKMITSDRKSLAGACNLGMEYANTDFICMLSSDDYLDKKAIAVLKRNIKKYPDVDFFYSSRRYMDEQGKLRGNIMRSKESFDLNYFKKIGSPVKNLLC